MDECICEPPVYNMSCPEHKEFFDALRSMPILVCENPTPEEMEKWQS